MNVRIVPRGQPQRTDTYTGINDIVCDGDALQLLERKDSGYVDHRIPLSSVAEILLDEEGAVS